MSRESKDAYIKAVQALKARPRGNQSDFANWNFDQFSDAHYTFQSDNHSTKTGGYKSAFFPWHRAFMNYYEKALQSIDPNVVQPYWDWSLDSQAPEKSMVFSDFGLDGDKSKNNCMTQGIAKDWTVTIGHSQPTCLRRCNGGLAQKQSWWSPEALAQAAINPSKTFREFAISVEDGSHGTIHSSLGGDCGAELADIMTMYSANDPIFYLHHAMTDKLWYKWQRSCKSFRNMYSGSQSTVLAPFPDTVKQVLSTVGSDQYCYEYSFTAGDVPLSPICEPSNTANFWMEQLIVDLINPAQKSSLVSKISASLKVAGTTIPLKTNFTTPERGDRLDRFNIRHPTPQSPKFLKMMDKDEEQVKLLNLRASKIVDELNRNPNRIDPSALIFNQ